MKILTRCLASLAVLLVMTVGLSITATPANAVSVGCNIIKCTVKFNKTETKAIKYSTAACKRALKPTSIPGALVTGGCAAAKVYLNSVTLRNRCLNITFWLPMQFIAPGSWVPGSRAC